MKLVTNRIPFSNNRSFEEIIKEHLEKNAKKKDQVVKIAAVKVAEEKEAPSSGQPEAEAKLVNVPEKDAPSKGSTCKKEEAPSSGQPEAEAKLTNDPKVEAETKEETKEAALEMCKECNKPSFACKCKKDEKEEDKEAEAVCEECKKANSACTCKKAEKKVKFVKIANLDDKTKSWLKEYWSKLYPTDYVDAMLSEK